MSSPSPIQRGLFIVAVGFLLIGVLFTINTWPAAALFTLIGGIGSLVFYAWFSRVSGQVKGPFLARHVAFVAFVASQILKVFEIGAGAVVMLLALVAFLVWVVWSVLTGLPRSED